MLTDVPGSSDYFLASLVTYSDRSKIDLLGVKKETLEKNGAVSEPVAREMAFGARKAAGADIGLSVTGIAGPGGGTLKKPVGLVYFCIDNGSFQRVEKAVFPGGREMVKKAAAEHALSMVAILLATP
jgi:PncC family amidohydrolase